MGRKIPKYVVFNMNIGGEFGVVAAMGDSKSQFLSQYHGKVYQVMAVKSLAEREEW